MNSYKIIIRKEERGFVPRILQEVDGHYAVELHPLGICEKTPNKALKKATDMIIWTHLEVELHAS